MKLQKEWKLWVENRVRIVCKNVSPENWFCVSTNSNPADVTTRVRSPSSFSSSLLWWQGLEFLCSREIELPSQQFLEPDVLPEVKCTAMVGLVGSDTIGIGEIVDCKRLGSLGKFLRVTGYITRFVFKLKMKLNGQGQLRKEEISVEEINESKYSWVRYYQSLYKNDSKFEKIKNSLNLFVDENFLFCSKTRFSDLKNLQYERRHPIILRNNFHFTDFVIFDAHQKVYHNGVGFTLNYIRATYWIVQGKQTVKMVLKKCVICKMVQGKTLIRLKEPTLPSFRVSYHYLFENIGTDYAGPIYYKVKLDLSHKMQKCYFLSITCSSSSTRALHLEVTCDVNATSLVLALRRFISRKVIPRVIFSDNFKSFKVSIVKEFCRNNFITWKFMLERSPWWGGFC